ncbi:F-box protein At3g07870-like [Papaver somniferum]|uniref:F-box protein At3g07870-like n=1 Tax=Papaver somniferum TaxID=3469 RepID=UPI000E700EE8|nr:F-box protein At3g07870-like [Papaver somniferum]
MEKSSSTSIFTTNALESHDSGKSGFTFYTTGVEKKCCYTEYDENLNRFSGRTRINLRPPQSYSILGSCNGLVCFKCKFHNEPVYICNPITREYIVLPRVVGLDLLTGFGYCPSTNEYKVVTIGWRNILVYTLGSGGIGWRNVKHMDRDIISRRQIGEFANGSIHWVDKRGTIFVFNLADEELHRLPTPPCLHRARFIVRVLGDFLCATIDEDCVRAIWRLKNCKDNEDGSAYAAVIDTMYAGKTMKTESFLLSGLMDTMYH